MKNMNQLQEEMAQKFDLADTPIPHKVGVLINTSLNPKGMPIATDPMDILQLFCAPGGHELDFVLLEEQLACFGGRDENLETQNDGMIPVAMGDSPFGMPVISREIIQLKKHRVSKNI